ncbi:ABC transporter permease [Xanthocytophaga flava]|uniref:ABC transporter permease n=1 Tax=Xanthocytophaga flava TaxID=3048013 RepID=UPI0028D41376|nr:ABC transporter permease [Xanthocytophaga flavus]MDJ1471793.1 ABC transporter permease [Xanthocytophaga flavus]
MVSSYLLVTWRNLIRNKVLSAIKIVGLGIGIALSLLIFLWVADEWQYDAFHTEGDLLYRVLLTQRYDDGQVSTDDQTPSLLAQALKKEFPEIQYAVTVTTEEKLLFQVGKITDKELGEYADEAFFAMFDFPLMQGNKRTVLSFPDQVVISQRLAHKYFRDQNPIGQIIRIDKNTLCKVSGVFRDIPDNSSLKFDFLLPFKALAIQYKWVHDWNAIGPRTFLKLHKTADVQKLNSKIESYLKDRQTEYQSTLSLQAYEDMYLHSRFANGKQAGGRIEYVWLFSIVAIFVLVIAAINFMNLTVAGAVTRFKEVGIRKINGASQGMIAGQFLVETLLITVFACLFAVLLIAMILPAFNDISGKHIQVTAHNFQFVGVVFFLFVLLIGISGLYPSLFLSSVKPVSVFKRTFIFRPGSLWFGKGLVVFQFSLSGLLILGTLIIHQQMEYIQDRNLGFDKENLIYKELDGRLVQNYNAFKNELNQRSSIQSITVCNQPPMQVGGTITSVEWPGKKPDEKIAFSYWGVGYGFVKTMNLQLKDGRDFSEQLTTDSVNVLLNEEAVKRMGLQNPVGQPITLHRSFVAKGRIIGIVKDFHLTSLHTAIDPLIMYLDPMPEGYMLVKTLPGKTRQAIADMEKVHKKYNPDFPFDYDFVNTAYTRLYKSEEVISVLSLYFSFFAIFISSIGLLGLTILTTTQRTKEVGIRKVLGASVSQITLLLSSDFLKLVLLANGIALPVGWYAMNQWLHNFAYRADVSWQVFMWTLILALGIAFLTISFQTIKAALQNPVKSLRTE